jgi:hypothetical protein
LLIGCPLPGTDDATWHDEHNDGEYDVASENSREDETAQSRKIRLPLMQKPAISNRLN